MKLSTINISDGKFHWSETITDRGWIMTMILIDFIWCYFQSLINSRIAYQEKANNRIIFCQKRTIGSWCKWKSWWSVLDGDDDWIEINARHFLIVLVKNPKKKLFTFWMICCENWIRHKLDVIDARYEITGGERKIYLCPNHTLKGKKWSPLIYWRCLFLILESFIV